LKAAGLNRPTGAPVKNPAATRRMAALIEAGVSPSTAARQVGLSSSSGHNLARRLADGRGMPESAQVDPPVPAGVVWHDVPVLIDTEERRGYRLGWADRWVIYDGLRSGLTRRQIAARIGRHPSAVTREINTNMGLDGVYQPVKAHEGARIRAKRPKTAKLALEGRLRDYVTDGLEQHLSPEQIANRIRLEYPNDAEMRVCHETIYQAIYVQARGGLKREVDKTLRRGGTYRKPRCKDGERRGRIPGMISIAERPDDVEERLIPGHWEGDLIVGKNSVSAVATLVERSSRVTMLGYLGGDHTAATVRDAIVPLLGSLPDVMRKTLTWDQGPEMACHLAVADQGDLDVYFADPHSPWQRGTNENTNGLLREYMPKGTDLSIHTPNDLQTIADSLNNRPRKVLSWLTPLEAFHLMLGHQVTIGGQPAKLPDTLKPLTQRCVDR